MAAKLDYLMVGDSVERKAVLLVDSLVAELALKLVDWTVEWMVGWMAEQWVKYSAGLLADMRAAH